MLIMLLLLSLLLLCALVALFTTDNMKSFIAWFIFSFIMIPVWYFLAMPWVALSQGVLGLAVTSWFIWCSLHQGESRS
jgi:uncharacterized MnhB-related membrane protein